MDFKYCRVQGKELAANTRTGKGIFSMLHQMVAKVFKKHVDSGIQVEIKL